MKSGRRILIVSTVLALPLLGLIAFRAYTYRSELLYIQLAELERVWARYVKEHRGQLPIQFDDLVGERYFSRIVSGSKTGFLTPSSDAGDLVAGFPGTIVGDLDMFEIAYGGSIGDFELRDDKVFQRGRNDEIVFVRTKRRDLLEAAKSQTGSILKNLLTPKQ